MELITCDVTKRGSKLRQKGLQRLAAGTESAVTPAASCMQAAAWSKTKDGCTPTPRQPPPHFEQLGTKGLAKPYIPSPQYTSGTWLEADN